MGGQVAIEDNSYKTWQRSGYGARMLLTTPGMVKARIARESKLLGGSFAPLDQSEHCLSQYCLCGHRAKKPRGQEWHSCKKCGLGDRWALCGACNPQRFVFCVLGAACSRTFCGSTPRW
jgi:hypothetical protein